MRAKKRKIKDGGSFPLSEFRERKRESAELSLPPSFGTESMHFCTLLRFLQYPGDQAASLMDIRTSLVYPLCLRDAK